MKKYMLVVLVLLGGCAQSVDTADSAREGGLRDTSLHALMAQRIDMLYQRIEVLAFDQNRTLPELDQDRQLASDQIVDGASALSSAASELMQLTDVLDLTESDRLQFQRLAQNLQSASHEVVQAATMASSVDLAASVSRLQATCSACHSLYREK